LEDVIQVAWHAVCVAVYDYDPTRNTKLSTYAWQRATAYIGHFYRDKTRAIRVPRTEQTLYYKIVEHASKNMLKEDICDLLNITPERYDHAMKVGVMEPGPLFDDTHEVSQSDYTATGVPAIGHDLSDREIEFLIEYLSNPEVCKGGKNSRQCAKAAKNEKRVRAQLQSLEFDINDFELLYNSGS